MSFAYKAHKQQGVLLNSNESSNKPSEKVMAEFARLLAEQSLNRYPQDEAFALRDAYADMIGVSPEQVLVTNGSDASLQILITAYCRDGKALIMLDPDFGMYRFYSHCVAAPVKSYQTAWDGSFDPRLLASYAMHNNAGLVMLSNPNNPTGHLLEKDKVEELAKAIAPTVLVMDEAYMDFDDESALDLIDTCDNLVVTRTLSKAWGAAGIRAGFLITNAKRAAKLADYRIVYSVSTLDQAAALAILSCEEDAKENIAKVRSERERIADRLAKIEGLRTGNFHANFYSIAWPGQTEALEKAFEEKNITVRTYPDHARIRITVGNPDENDLVLDVIEAFAASKGESHA